MNEICQLIKMTNKYCIIVSSKGWHINTVIMNNYQNHTYSDIYQYDKQQPISNYCITIMYHYYAKFELLCKNLKQ